MLILPPFGGTTCAASSSVWWSTDVETTVLWAEEDGSGTRAILSQIKVLVILRFSRTGDSYNSMDDVTGMGKEMDRIYFQQFYKDVIKLFGSTYHNKRPEIAKLIKCGSEIWTRWIFRLWIMCRLRECCSENYPLARKRKSYRKRDGKMATVVAKEWFPGRLYIWSWFFNSVCINNTLSIFPFHQPLKT